MTAWKPQIGDVVVAQGGWNTATGSDITWTGVIVSVIHAAMLHTFEVTAVPFGSSRAPNGFTYMAHTIRHPTPEELAAYHMHGPQEPRFVHAPHPR